MSNPAKRVANHIREVAKFDKSKSMLENFKAYFGKEEIMTIVQCLHFINKEIDIIENMLKERGVALDAVKKARSLFSFECLHTAYSSYASHNTQEFPMIFDGYALSMQDESIELDDIKKELSDLVDSIEDETIKEIMLQTLEALEMYPCAGLNALKNSLVTALGRFGLYMYKKGTNEQTKRLSEIFEKILQTVEKVQRAENAIRYLDDTMRQLFFS